jgi:hypothetical protein
MHVVGGKKHQPRREKPACRQAGMRMEFSFGFFA